MRTKDQIIQDYLKIDSTKDFSTLKLEISYVRDCMQLYAMEVLEACVKQKPELQETEPTQIQKKLNNNSPVKYNWNFPKDSDVALVPVAVGDIIGNWDSITKEVTNESLVVGISVDGFPICKRLTSPTLPPSVWEQTYTGPQNFIWYGTYNKCR